jgi:plasmid stabilization system protein ParE
MAKKISWTPESEKTFEAILTYLKTHWTEKEIRSFVAATYKTIDTIAKQPLLFRKTKKPDIHEALITKHNLLLYRIKEHQIDLITFWDTRKNPKKKLKT